MSDINWPELVAGGATPVDIARRAQREGLSFFERIRLTRELYGLDLTSAKRADHQARVGSSPEDGQAALADEIAALQGARPLVLDPSLEVGARHLPAHMVWALVRTAPQVVANPDAVFRGLRRDGGLRAGMGWCARPAEATGPDGDPLPAPEGKVFVVYADDDGFVFDWSWVEADDHGLPVGHAERFAKRLDSPPAAALVGVDRLEPGQFDPSEGVYSQKGDCLFAFVSEEPSYARRINDDLTVYRALDGDAIVGLKLKNLSSIIKRAVQALQDAHGTPFPKQIELQVVLKQSWVRQSLDGAETAYEQVLERLRAVHPTPRLWVHPGVLAEGSQVAERP